MAERLAPTKAAPKAVKPRSITQHEEHAVEVVLNRRDGSGQLIKATIDLTRGTAQFVQPTTPITFKGKTLVGDIEDIIDFYTAVRDYVATGAPSVLVFDNGEAEAADGEDAPTAA